MEMFIFFISLIQYKKILRYRKSVFRRTLSQADICDSHLASCLIRLKSAYIIQKPSQTGCYKDSDRIRLLP